jgi:hypothetical protein
VSIEAAYATESYNLYSEHPVLTTYKQHSNNPSIALNLHGFQNLVLITTAQDTIYTKYMGGYWQHKVL